MKGSSEQRRRVIRYLYAACVIGSGVVAFSLLSPRANRHVDTVNLRTCRVRSVHYVWGLAVSDRQVALRRVLDRHGQRRESGLAQGHTGDELHVLPAPGDLDFGSLRQQTSVFTDFCATHNLSVEEIDDFGRLVVRTWADDGNPDAQHLLRILDGNTDHRAPNRPWSR